MSIPTLPFGRTGHTSTRILFGAAALSRVSQADADRTLDLITSYGINHIDVAASYGEAELRLAPWLREHRNDVFLATKTGERRADTAMDELKRSLDRLGVDHLDLWQMHNLSDPIQWDTALSPGGVIEAMVAEDGARIEEQRAHLAPGEHDFNGQSAWRLLEDFLRIREELLWNLEFLNDEWDHAGMHPYRGRISLMRYLREMTDRDLVQAICAFRLLSKMPTLAAAAHRFSVGMPFVYPDNSLKFTENFLSMMWKIAEPRFDANPVLARALDVLFILHADHEQNCSTTAMRVVGSSHADPYSATAAAAAALYGPRHGGANEAVIRMLTDIGSIENVEPFIESVKSGQGGRLQGFGHRVYKSYDPRAKIIKRTADEVFAVTGKNPLLDIALKLEEIALSDDYFVSRKLYPNVDFYSGLIYQAMGFPLEMFPVLFAIPRTAGWLAHWQELLTDKEQKISRPRQWYTGAEARDYVAMGAR